MGGYKAWKCDSFPQIVMKAHTRYTIDPSLISLKYDIELYYSELSLW